MTTAEQFERLKKAGYPVRYRFGGNAVPELPDEKELQDWLSERVVGIGFCKHKGLWYIERMIAKPDGLDRSFYSVVNADLTEALIQSIEQAMKPEAEVIKEGFMMYRRVHE